MIIFLDFDGVIIPFREPTGQLVCSGVEAALADHSKEAVLCVTELAQFTGARIVVISYWRRTLPKDVIERFLHDIGLGPYLHNDWLAWYRFTSLKVHDIANWLEDHPEVSDWVVIDDEPIFGFGSHEHCRLRQIVPNGRVGFTRTDLLSARSALSTCVGDKAV